MKIAHLYFNAKDLRSCETCVDRALPILTSYNLRDPDTVELKQMKEFLIGVGRGPPVDAEEFF